MGSIVSAIGRGINAIISAIAMVIETIISAIVTVIVTIFDVILDICAVAAVAPAVRAGVPDVEGATVVEGGGPEGPHT
ncbi:hypothetical protein BC826DRAFT_1037076, partial [Russula brevipes]